MPSQPQDPVLQDVTVSSSQSQHTPISQEENNNEVEQVLSQKMGELSSQEKPEIKLEAELPADFNATDINDDPSEEVHCNVNESVKNKRAKRGAEDDSATSPTKKANSEINLEFENPDDVPDVAAEETSIIKVVTPSTRDPHADIITHVNALTKEIVAQTPGFDDCAELEEPRSLDSSEIVEEMLSNVKGSVRNSQYERFYDTLFNLIDPSDSQSQEEPAADSEEEGKEESNDETPATPVNSEDNVSLP